MHIIIMLHVLTNTCFYKSLMSIKILMITMLLIIDNIGWKNIFDSNIVIIITVKITILN